MIDIPIEFHVKYLKTFYVCRFKDINHSSEAPRHYYITVPCKDSKCLILCLITSQTERKEDFYARNNRKALDSLVYLNKEDFPFLTKGKSIIDCNSAKYYTSKKAIIRIIDPKYGFDILCENIPKKVKKDIFQALKKSPLLSLHVKREVLKVE
ncbi:MAG: hypothetical protein KAI03_03465 [Candidatus Aureabacteria bacterium]|nr:hypothetical protein [Candidatus Auribacterota bacterium]